MFISFDKNWFSILVSFWKYFKRKISSLFMFFVLYSILKDYLFWLDCFCFGLRNSRNLMKIYRSLQTSMHAFILGVSENFFCMKTHSLIFQCIYLETSNIKIVKFKTSNKIKTMFWKSLDVVIFINIKQKVWKCDMKNVHLENYIYMRKVCLMYDGLLFAGNFNKFVVIPYTLHNPCSLTYFSNKMKHVHCTHLILKI